ncbi:MAG: O-antigen ligase family protein [Acidobacteriia bacterium]|nr:O-antigen ligase family protein [Terriglobia bacterium]
MLTETSAGAAQNSQAAVERPSSPSFLDPILFYGTLGLLLFGPLAFGAVEAWSIFILETGAALLFVLWAVRQARSGELQILSNPLFFPMLVFAALVVLQLGLGLTAYRYQTFSTALLYCSYGLLSFLVVQCLRRTAQVKLLTIAFSSYGFAMAMFAVIQGISSKDKLYWVRTPAHGGWIYGPYVNHDHYAGLMEMLVPIPLVFALTRYARGPRKTMAAVAAAVMASSIFLSGSRGGMAAFAVQIAVLAAFTIRRQKSGRTALAAGIFLVIVVGLLAWLGGGELARRMASIHTEARAELSGGTRLAIDRDTLRMFTHKPILGWGLGVFANIYPQFRTFYTNFFVNAAHNDYLQLLVEMGALGFATMLWFVVVAYSRAIKKLGNWPSDTNGAVALAAMLGVTGILVHSLVDFNLQIPANAALFYVLCIIAAMEPRFGLPRRTSRQREGIQEASSG